MENQFQPSFQTFGLYDYVKRTIFDKWNYADSLLHKVLLDLKVDKPTKKIGQSSYIGEFNAAVLAEYRSVRAKLGYQEHNENPMFADLVKRLGELRALDSLTLSYTRSEVGFEQMVRAHLLIGEFLEADGITKFEMRERNLLDEALAI